MPGAALVSVNARMVAGRPDLAVSTAAHELGHVVFDIPAALGEQARHYRSVTTGPNALLDGTTAVSERRANEFMGALLAPPVQLHLRMLLHARSERLRTLHAPHRGRPGSRVLAADNHPEAIEGVVAALAGDFGVSERFIAVRLSRYGLVQDGPSHHAAMSGNVGFFYALIFLDPTRRWHFTYPVFDCGGRIAEAGR
jgi:hypothetical protein